MTLDLSDIKPPESEEEVVFYATKIKEVLGDEGMEKMQSRMMEIKETFEQIAEDYNIKEPAYDLLIRLLVKAHSFGMETSQSAFKNFTKKQP